MSCVANVSFEGVSGHIAFDQGSDPVKNILIERIEGNLIVSCSKVVVFSIISAFHSLGARLK